MKVESPDGLVDDVLAVLADPMLSGALLEPVRGVLVRLALLDPNHSLSNWVLGTCGRDIPPETPWPADDPLSPFDDPQLAGHDGVLRLAAWLPGHARARAQPYSALRGAAEVTDNTHARLNSALALGGVDPEVRGAAESGLRSLAVGDAGTALSSLAAVERLTAERRLPTDDKSAQAALDELAGLADPLQVDGATRRALDRFRDSAHRVPTGAPMLLAAARQLVDRNRTPVTERPPEADGESDKWWQPIRLQGLPPVPRRIALVSLFLLPPALVLLARDPLTRSIGPVVDIEGVGQLSVLVFSVGMLMLGWSLGALTRIFAAHHSRLALLPICAIALWSTTHAQWVRGVIGTVVVTPTVDAIEFESRDRSLLVLWLVISFVLRVAALAAPVLILFYRARPERRRLAQVASLSVGLATALPGVAVVALLGVGGDESALVSAVGTGTVSAAITSQINATFMVILYLLLPLACFEVFETLRSAVDGVGSFFRTRASLQKPSALLAIKGTYLVAGFAGVLPAVIGGDRGVWSARPESFAFAAGAVLAAAAVGFLLRRAGPKALASARWWVLVAAVVSLSNVAIEAVLHLLSMNFPRVVTPVSGLADPNYLGPTASAVVPCLLAALAGAGLLLARRPGPALCLALAAVVALPSVARSVGNWTYDLFGIEEFDIALTVFVGIVLLIGRRDAASAPYHRSAATVLLAVSTTATFGAVSLNIPARGAYVGAVVVATGLALLRAEDINRHAARSPETASALVVTLVVAAVVAGIVLQSSVYFAGISDGEPVLLDDWQGFIETAGRVVAPLFVAVWFMPDLIARGRPRGEP